MNYAVAIRHVKMVPVTKTRRSIPRLLKHSTYIIYLISHVIWHMSNASAYEKGYPGYPGIPLSDLKPVGLWSHPEALRGLLKPSEARWSPQRLLEALRGSPKSSKAPSKASEACRGSLRPFEALQLMVFLSDLNSRRTWNSKGIPRKFLSPYADVSIRPCFQRKSMIFHWSEMLSDLY